MKKLSLVIAAFLAVFATSNLSAELLTKKFDAKTVDSLELKNTSGKVTISGTDGKEAIVNADKIKMDPDCKLTIEQRNSLIYLSVENESWLKRGQCWVNFDIKIPKITSIDLKSGSGDTEINDTNGKVRFLTGSGHIRIKSQISSLEGRIGSGSIKVSGTVGNFEIRSGSGSIDLEGCTDEGDIQNGSGKISLKYSKIKSGGELKIRSGSGDSTIYLPSDSKIATDFMVGSGRIANEFGDSENPVFKIAFKAGSGDLKIKKTK